MPHSPWVRKLIIAAVLLALASLLMTFSYVKLGLFNVAASRPHSAFVEWITHETMIHSVARRAQPLTSAQVTQQQAVRGFCQYEAHCVACHGGPAVAREAWANGMNPTPPYLLDTTRRWSPGQLDWIVRNGIKMTGMPAWRDTLSDRQIRDVVSYLEAMPKMPPQAYLEWRAAELCRR